MNINTNQHKHSSDVCKNNINNHKRQTLLKKTINNHIKHPHDLCNTYNIKQKFRPRNECASATPKKKTNICEKTPHSRSNDQKSKSYIETIHANHHKHSSDVCKNNINNHKRQTLLKKTMNNHIKHPPDLCNTYNIKQPFSPRNECVSATPNKKTNICEKTPHPRSNDQKSKSYIEIIHANQYKHSSDVCKKTINNHKLQTLLKKTMNNHIKHPLDLCNAYNIKQPFSSRNECVSATQKKKTNICEKTPHPRSNDQKSKSYIVTIHANLPNKTPDVLKCIYTFPFPIYPYRNSISYYHNHKRHICNKKCNKNAENLFEKSMKQLYEEAGKSIKLILYAFKNKDDSLSELLVDVNYSKIENLLNSLKGHDDSLFEQFRLLLVNSIEGIKNRYNENDTEYNELLTLYNALKLEYDELLTRYDELQLEYNNLPILRATADLDVIGVSLEITEYIRRGYKIVNDQGELIPIDMDILNEIKKELADCILHHYP